MPSGTITALRAQVNGSQRINVFVNDAFAMGVSLVTLQDEQLYVGKLLTEEEYARLEAAEQASKAYQSALRALEARPRSSTEIRDKLRLKGFEPEAIEPAIERLSTSGLVDDASFARFWVENRQANKPRGPGALRNELRRKGIDRNLINDVLDDATLTGDLDENAMIIARGALRKYARAADKQTFMRRMGGFLQRRGFTFETIRPIIDLLWNELQEEKEAESQEPADN